MKVYVVPESYRPSTKMFQAEPNEVSTFAFYKNSWGAFQLLLHDGKKNHYSLDDAFSIPDAIEIPIYRIAIESKLPVEAQFIDYYLGGQDIGYGDKLLEEKAKTYTGDRFAPVYVNIPISQTVPSGSYPVKINIFRSFINQKEQLICSKDILFEVKDFTFANEITNEFHLDIWQQPSNLARTYHVPMWSDRHFDLIAEMAEKLAALGQKAVTVIAGEIPWKGWFNYIVKDYPANLYEYSMIQVKKSAGTLTCDFRHLDRYLAIMKSAGIHQEIDVFGLLGVWQPPFFPQVKELEHPEKLVIRYYDETEGVYNFITDKKELKDYLAIVFQHFKELGIWEQVYILSDEPKIHEVEQFKQALKILKEVEPTIKVKVAFDKEPVLQQLLPEIDYPVTSYFCTCNNIEKLNQTHPGKTQYYICNYPTKPNTFLHSPLLESRVQGILAYHFGTNGLLRWAFNCWPENIRQDVRYNVAALPIGDLCLVYPSYSGHILLSLRYKQLLRGIEDFWLLHKASLKNEEKTKAVLAEFLGNPDTKDWMIDSHQANPDYFLQTEEDYQQLREQLIGLIH